MSMRRGRLLGMPELVPMKLNYQCELCGVKFSSVIPVDAKKVPPEKRAFYMIGLCHECAVVLRDKKKAKEKAERDKAETQ